MNNFAWECAVCHKGYNLTIWKGTMLCRKCVKEIVHEQGT